MEAEGRGAFGAVGVLALVSGGRSGAGLEAGLSLDGREVIRDWGWLLHSDGQGHPG